MITILGGGLAGLSAAYHLKQDSIILEKELGAGGLSRSFTYKNYTFDYGSHIMFTRDEYVKKLYQSLLKGNLISHVRRCFIFMEDTYVKYPFEVNLFPLSENTIKECIEGVKNRDVFEPKNFKEWIITTFGEGIAKHYMLPYNEKVWCYDLEKMNMDWIAGRVPTPSIEEMKKGAEGEVNHEYGPNAKFMYPNYGGIGALPNSLSNGLTIKYNSTVVGVKPKKKEVIITYEKEGILKKMVSPIIFSSLPLPDVINMIDDVPTHVTKAAESLVYNSIVYVHLGIKRPKINDKHWLYFPEDHFLFNRISFPMNFSPNSVPKNRSSIQAEVTYRGNLASLDDTLENVIGDLIEASMVNEKDEIEVKRAVNCKYAYVIYDLDHKKNVNIILDYLNKNQIISIGRWGEWEYFNMDKAITSGKRAADNFNEG